MDFTQNRPLWGRGHSSCSQLHCRDGPSHPGAEQHLCWLASLPSKAGAAIPLLVTLGSGIQGWLFTRWPHGLWPPSCALLVALRVD